LFGNRVYLLNGQGTRGPIRTINCYDWGGRDFSTAKPRFANVGLLEDWPEHHALL